MLLQSNQGVEGLEGKANLGRTQTMKGGREETRNNECEQNNGPTMFSKPATRDPTLMHHLDKL